MAEQHGNPKKRDGSVLLFAQGIVCGVVLLIALVVRLIGSDIYAELRGVFRDALVDNGVVDTVVSWMNAESANA